MEKRDSSVKPACDSSGTACHLLWKRRLNIVSSYRGDARQGRGVGLPTSKRHTVGANMVRPKLLSQALWTTPPALRATSSGRGGFILSPLLEEMPDGAEESVYPLRKGKSVGANMVRPKLLSQALWTTPPALRATSSGRGGFILSPLLEEMPGRAEESVCPF